MSESKKPAAPEAKQKEQSVTLDVLAWICLKNKQILCARTRGNTLFYLPGGKREVGESDAAGIAREVKEELGVTLDPETLIETLVVKEKAHGYTASTWVIMKCFQADYRGQLAAHSEIEEIAWLKLADRAQCAPATQRVLEHLAENSLID